MEALKIKKDAIDQEELPQSKKELFITCLQLMED